MNLVSEAATRRQLENGPYGGTPVRVGDEPVGEALECPLTVGAQWQGAGIADLALAVHELGHGRVWVPGQAVSEVKTIPIMPLAQVATIGFLHRDINGAGGRGAFDILDQRSPSATYPTLWGHDAPKERSLIVEPDSEARVRVGKERRAADIWATRSHAHHNADFRFNSQSLAVAFTETPTLGGRSWPNLVFNDIRQEITFTLWGNSTLGLLCY